MWQREDSGGREYSNSGLIAPAAPPLPPHNNHSSNGYSPPPPPIQAKSLPLAEKKGTGYITKPKGTISHKEDWSVSRSSSFWIPQNLYHHMIRQAGTGDTVLVKGRKMTGRTQTLSWWLEEEQWRRQKWENKLQYIDPVILSRTGTRKCVLPAAI